MSPLATAAWARPAMLSGSVCWPNVQEPLQADQRLHYLVAPLAMPHRVDDSPRHCSRTPSAVQFDGDGGSGGETLHTGVAWRRRQLVRQPSNPMTFTIGQVVALADFEVNGKSCPGVTFRAPVPNSISIAVVSNDGNLAPHDGQRCHPARPITLRVSLGRRDGPQLRCRPASIPGGSWRR